MTQQLAPAILNELEQVLRVQAEDVRGVRSCCAVALEWVGVPVRNAVVRDRGERQPGPLECGNHPAGCLALAELGPEEADNVDSTRLLGHGASVLREPVSRLWGRLPRLQASDEMKRALEDEICWKGIEPKPGAL
jgi:hypothetical protein